MAAQGRIPLRVWRGRRTLETEILYSCYMQWFSAVFGDGKTFGHIADCFRLVKGVYTRVILG